jgi:hypothetical protein
MKTAFTAWYMHNESGTKEELLSGLKAAKLQVSVELTDAQRMTRQEQQDYLNGIIARVAEVLESEFKARFEALPMRSQTGQVCGYVRR